MIESWLTEVNQVVADNGLQEEAFIQAFANDHVVVVSKYIAVIKGYNGLITANTF